MLDLEIRLSITITYFQGLGLGNLVAISDDTGVQTLRDVTLRLLQKLSHQQNNRCCSITGNIILCGRSASDHNLLIFISNVYETLEAISSYSRGVLNLLLNVSLEAPNAVDFEGRTNHLPQQNVSIFGQFDLS